MNAAWADQSVCSSSARDASHFGPERRNATKNTVGLYPAPLKAHATARLRVARSPSCIACGTSAAPLDDAHTATGTPSGRASSAPSPRTPMVRAVTASSALIVNGTRDRAPAASQGARVGPVNSVHPGPRRSRVETRPDAAGNQRVRDAAAEVDRQLVDDRAAAPVRVVERMMLCSATTRRSDS